MKFNELNKFDLEELINNSNSITEILRKMGVKPNSGNFQTLHRYVNKFDLSLETILNNKNKYLNNKNSVKYSMNEILIKNSGYSNTTKLKQRLYKEGLKKPICEMCGQDEIWYGEKMALILDHINGDHYDNRLENLRIICPNCNATLPTHGGKNINFKKNEKKINNKNIIIDSYKKRRIVERPPYDVLIKDINEMGYSATGRKYGVSDNAIRKWIKFYIKFNN